MIIYDLICDTGHEFEGWFKNTEDLLSQQESKLLTCPFCGSESVNKKLAAPKVSKKSNSVANQAPENVAVSIGNSKEQYEQLQTLLGKVHDYVDSNFVDVGNRFADEALSIHRGEKEPANIRGTASKTELKELADEGVSAVPLPAKPVSKKDLN